MKLLLSLFTVFMITGTLLADEQGSGEGLKWYTNYQQAAEVAQKDRKPMILFFTGSDWCGWCKKLDKEVFATPEFAQMAGNKFVYVMLDFPMNQQQSEDIKQQNAQLKQRYGVTGYPTVVILDQSGGFLAETGYRSGGGAAYAKYLSEFFNS